MQIINLLIMYFSPQPCHFLRLTQTSVPKHPQTAKLTHVLEETKYFGS
jgi:hypothetical protein